MNPPALPRINGLNYDLDVLQRMDFSGIRPLILPRIGNGIPQLPRLDRINNNHVGQVARPRATRNINFLDQIDINQPLAKKERRPLQLGSEIGPVDQPRVPEIQRVNQQSAFSVYQRPQSGDLSQAPILHEGQNAFHSEGRYQPMRQFFRPIQTPPTPNTPRTPGATPRTPKTSILSFLTHLK